MTIQVCPEVRFRASAGRRNALVHPRARRQQQVEDHPAPTDDEGAATGDPRGELREPAVRPYVNNPGLGGLFTQAAYLQFWGVGEFARHRLGCQPGTVSRRGRADASADVCRLAASGRVLEDDGLAPVWTSRVSPSEGALAGAPLVSVAECRRSTS